MAHPKRLTERRGGEADRVTLKERENLREREREEEEETGHVRLSCRRVRIRAGFLY